MPVPAPLTPGHDGDTGPNLIMTFRDPLDRPLEGTATIRAVSGPALSLTATVTGGRLELSLTPGRWSVGAMLRDPDGIRTYRAEEVQID